MTVVRIVALQAAWWATVLLAGARHDAWAVAPQLAFVVFAVALGPRRAGRAALAAASAALGVATDAALLAAGATAFPASSWSPSSSSPLPPPFMIALWAAFGVALPSSLHLRARTLAAAAAVGAVAGPLSYRGGAAFDAIALAPGALPAIGVAWAIALPLLLLLARVLAAPPQRSTTESGAAPA